MPKRAFGSHYRFLKHSEVLSFEEIARVTAIFAGLGVDKVRLTGGEPTLRRDLPRLVEKLARIRGLREINLTTNGSRLTELATPLRDAGLSRVTVSLDSLDDKTFRAMNDVGFPVGRVLDGLEAARAAGFENIKVNTVVKRGVNDAAVLEIAEFFRWTGINLRFIEFMDVGTTNRWRMDDVIPADEILELVGRRFPIKPLAHQYRDGVAERWRYADGAGELGVIASVTRPFCGDCSRLRMTADGRLYTCLFGIVSHDLRGPLRTGASEASLADTIGRLWARRSDQYSESRGAEGPAPAPQRVEMSFLGG
jgi:cyclic pyranopterin phosphate synthase